MRELQDTKRDIMCRYVRPQTDLLRNNHVTEPGTFFPDSFLPENVTNRVPECCLGKVNPKETRN